MSLSRSNSLFLNSRERYATRPYITRIKFITTDYSSHKDLFNNLVKEKIAIRSLSISVTVLIKDQEEVLIVVKTPKQKNDRYSMHVVDSNLACSHAEYFQTLWKKARPI